MPPKLLTLMLALLLTATFLAGCTDEGGDDDDKEEGDDGDGGDDGDDGTDGGDGDDNGTDGGDGGDGGDGDDGGDDGGDLSLEGKFQLNEESNTATVTLTHNGGPSLTWADYLAHIEGHELTEPKKVSDDSAAATTGSGESVYWTFTYEEGQFLLDQQYIMTIVELLTDDVIWEDILTAEV